MMGKNLKLDEIVSIEPVGRQQTYDFSMPETHCFFANDFLVHNSDLVLLLHWDYFYSNDLKKYSKFDIIIAKQKNGITGKVICSFQPQFYLFSEPTLEQLTAWGKISASTICKKGAK